MSGRQVKYQRILLKLSGEALGHAGGGIDPQALRNTAVEIKRLVELGVEVGLVLGGGNLVRGARFQEAGLDRVTADQMGMLATVMNALALGDLLAQEKINALIMSAIPMGRVVEHYHRRTAIQHLQSGGLVIFAAGTGNPLFTTDSAACLRAIEINAEILLKATKVDGVYSADPMVDASACRYARLTYDEVLEQQLAVMDSMAICLAREHKMPMRVFAMHKPDALLRIVAGEDEGTLITDITDPVITDPVITDKKAKPSAGKPHD